jgi:hypothetical protein
VPKSMPSVASVVRPKLPTATAARHATPASTSPMDVLEVEWGAAPALRGDEGGDGTPIAPRARPRSDDGGR